MEKDIKIRTWVDEQGIIRCVSAKGKLTISEMGSLILEIERTLNKFKEEYFSFGVSGEVKNEK